MLPALYQNHLKSQLSLTEYIFLKILINLLQSIKKVNLEKLANTLPLPIKFESRRKRLQRFLSLPNLTIEKIWFPIFEELLKTYFTSESLIYLAIDRTNWGRINLFMVSLIWDKSDAARSWGGSAVLGVPPMSDCRGFPHERLHQDRAFPIYFTLLPKLGSSNLTEQQSILSKIVPIIKNYKVCVLGDREFCSVKLAKYLQSLGVYFCLRLKNNEFVEYKKDNWVALNDLGLIPGVSLFIQGVKAMQRGLGEAARSWGFPP